LFFFKYDPILQRLSKVFFSELNKYQLSKGN